MTATDYTTYKDSELPAYARFDPAAQAEIDRREAAGESDGSVERVAAFMSNARKGRKLRER